MVQLVVTVDESLEEVLRVEQNAGRKHSSAKVLGDPGPSATGVLQKPNSPGLICYRHALLLNHVSYGNEIT
jgi:hypothetical protein